MIKNVLLAALVAVSMPAVAGAQQRPLVTEDPEGVGPRQVLLELGIDQLWEQKYPASGLEGNLLRVPTFSVSIGLGIAELQVDGAAFQRLQITNRVDAPMSGVLDIDGDQTNSLDDIVIGTKIRLMSEAPGRPALGVRFATKLPNASNENGLGLDTTDFYASVLVAKTIQSMRIVGNAGIGILGDVTRGGAQNDVLTYGLSFARALTVGSEVVAEINGRLHTSDAEAPPGTQSSAIARGGLRFTKGPVRIDGALILGLLDDDPKFGVTAGLTWVFNAFTP